MDRNISAITSNSWKLSFGIPSSNGGDSISSQVFTQRGKIWKKLIYAAAVVSILFSSAGCLVTKTEFQREKKLRRYLVKQFLAFKESTEKKLRSQEERIKKLELALQRGLARISTKQSEIVAKIRELRKKVRQGEGGIIEMFTTLQKLQVKFQESLGQISQLQEQIRDLLQKFPQYEKQFEEIRQKYEELLKNQKLLAEQAIPAKLFARARDAYKSKNYGDAIKYFKQFLGRFPAHPLADNALLYLGDIYRKKGNVSEAILSYSEILKKYPSGSEAPYALFHLGILHYQQGLCSEGRNFFKKLRFYRGRAPKLAKKAATLYRYWKKYCKKRSKKRRRKRR